MVKQSFQKSLEKGSVDEEIIIKYLNSQRWVVYKPTTEEAHAFDFLCIRDKVELMAVDVKAKAKRNKYNDTGVDKVDFDHYENYSKEHKMDFFIFFVDELEKRVYGNSIKELIKPCEDGMYMYPRSILTGKEWIKYFSLKQMIHVSNLTDEQCEELKSKSQRNHGYGIKG